MLGSTNLYGNIYSVIYVTESRSYHKTIIKINGNMIAFLRLYYPFYSLRTALFDYRLNTTGSIQSMVQWKSAVYVL